MKKLILWLAAAALLLSLCACDTGNESTDSSPKEKEQQTETQNTPAGAAEQSSTEQTTAAPEPDGEGTIGDYYIKIVSAEKGKDYGGKDVIVVTYEWTNNSDEEKMFSTAFTAKAYQNGIECVSAYLVDGVDSQKTLANIKPGTSMEVKEAYELNDSSEVLVEVGEWLGFDNTKVEKKFVLE